ncbi:MAG TPA: ABC transporter permease [Polyangiaceae bacterium]|nr:ABC transporter permease [Polyangiaceae bacterium]
MSSFFFDIDTWQEIWSTLKQNRLRALLTASGVFWGLFMLILLLGLGRGLERGALALSELAPRAVYVWAQRTGVPYRGLQPGRFVRFEDEDIARLRAIPGVEFVAARLRFGGWRDNAQVSHAGKTGAVNVLGDMPDYARIEPIGIDRGRFLNQPDELEARKVAVIGSKARGVLFGDASPLGQRVEVNGVHFLVVGEIHSDKSGDDGDRINNTVFIPFRTFQQTYNQRNRVGWFTLGVREGASSADVERDVRRVLAANHRVSPLDEQAIGSFDAAAKYEKIRSLFAGIRTFVWFVGTLTLFSGVLGVSNILLIIVKERTREIGVRKALGATPGSIVRLVVQESMALTTLAGYTGLVAGVAALEGIARLVEHLDGAPLRSPEVDFRAALVAALVLVVAGAVAGIVPARHAAGIPPVEALRAE